MSTVNPDIGEIKCAWCHSMVPVRKNRNCKLYVACANCGQQPLNASGGQEIILERATIFGAAKPTPISVESAPVVENKPVDNKIQSEKPRESSGFSFLDA